MTQLINQKSRAIKILENILFITCLGVIVLRIRISEIPLPQSSDSISFHIFTPISLLISIVLIAAFLFWLAFSILTGNFFYRKSLLEIGLILLVIASCISCFAASNKSAAISNTVIFMAPVFMAILLIQILTSDLKVKLTLAVVAAAGFLNAFQSADQFFKGSDEMISLYKENQKQVLDFYGIEPGTVEQFMLEHRLLSKNISGYLTTSNSAGSFLILAFFAAGILLIEKIRNRNLPGADEKFVLSAGIVVLVILISLILTRSKGAIAAFLVALVLFALFCFLRNWFYIRRKIIFIACLLLAVLTVGAVFFISRSNRTLPGGNSILVRQQYWQTALEAYENNPVAGIGPGNFADAYFRYKLPQSLETVSDPHNFIISILLQYGPLGLTAFLSLIFVPILRIVLAKSFPAVALEEEGQVKFNKFIIPILLFIALLFARLAAGPLTFQITEEERMAAFIYLYLVPAFAFLLGFLLLTSGPKSTILNHQPNYPAITITALFCSIAAVLIHNLVDFAIFEPAVLTAFFAVFACLISTDLNSRRLQTLYTPFLSVKLLTVAASILIVLVLVLFAYLPVYKSIRLVNSAKQFADIGYIDQAHPLLDKADKDDPLNPLASSMNGRFYIINYAQNSANIEPLLKAETCFLEAIKRDKASFKDYERLSNVYLILSQNDTDKTKQPEWLNKTFEAAQKAVSLYPSSDRLRLYFAQICELAGKKDLAVENYKKAVEFEDAYREQFKKLYPKNPLFSRLGLEKYNTALQKIKQLSNPP